MTAFQVGAAGATEALLEKLIILLVVLANEIKPKHMAKNPLVDENMVTNGNSAICPGLLSLARTTYIVVNKYNKYLFIF